MLKAVLPLLLLASFCGAQSSSDGSFSVRHVKNASFSLTAAQMREAEKLYQSACAVITRDFQSNFSSGSEIHPRFAVIVGTDLNEVHGRTEIWLKQWDPAIFVEGVVVLAFNQVLTPDRIKQLGSRALRYSNATVDVAGLK